MTDQKIRAAIQAAAPGAPATAWESLVELPEDCPIFAGDLRLAHTIGQCAHESVGFARTSESLWYSAPRLMAVWPGRFPTIEAAEPYAGNPEALANNVYGGRMGNVDPGDGYRYRGQGWLQLTGRDNYRRYGRALGIDLEGNPELAAHPRTAWMVAAHYLATRRRAKRTALEWADADNAEMVTRIVNGGLHGLDDRRARTAAALMALRGAQPTLQRGSRGPAVRVLQQRLAAHGLAVGALDGHFGARTEAAVVEFQRQNGLLPDGVAGPLTQSKLAAPNPP